MGEIGFLILAHKSPARVSALARTFAAGGDAVVIHYDASAPSSEFASLRASLADLDRVRFARRRRCGWGTWSLVGATLDMMRLARSAFPTAGHLALVCGDTVPTKSRDYFQRFLAERADQDMIEAVDFDDGGWIKTGMTRDRLRYRHWFNERRHRSLFYGALAVQRRLRLTRKTPRGIDIRIGSQWWILRVETVDRLLALVRVRPDIRRFFRTVWIPDETFFQTLVGHLVPAEQISGAPPVHLGFSDYGMPAVWHADHESLLIGQAEPLARKISPRAASLYDRFLTRYGSAQDVAEGTHPVSPRTWLIEKGRHGQRHAGRFWDRAIAPQADGTVLLIAARDRALGDRVAEAAAAAIGLDPLGRVFDGVAATPVDLGHLETSLDARGRHRRALVNLLFDVTGRRTLLMIVDPGRRDILEDLAGHVGDVRVLSVEQTPAHDDLVAEGQIRGVLGASPPGDLSASVVEALRHQVGHDRAALASMRQIRLFRSATDRPVADNVLDIARFLDCCPERAARVAGIAQGCGAAEEDRTEGARHVIHLR